jgi:predicted nucleic acid-binding protein
MNLPDILNGATVFVDANIFIYAVERRSPQCRQLLDRIDGEAVRAFSSSIVLAEVCHRRMVNEAKGAGLISGANPARLLGKKPGGVQGLNIYAQNVRDLLDSPIVFEPIRPEDFYVALELQKQHGLLTNDSLNLAVSRRLGLQELATADTSFDGVQGIIVYKPSDINPTVQ